jgi:hypothetical protein
VAKAASERAQRRGRRVERAAQPVGLAGEARRSSIARPKTGSTSAEPAGACRESSRSRQSGIVPMPYSIPVRVRLTTAGGKPM